VGQLGIGQESAGDLGRGVQAEGGFAQPVHGLRPVHPVAFENLQPARSPDLAMPRGVHKPMTRAVGVSSMMQNRGGALTATAQITFTANRPHACGDDLHPRCGAWIIARHGHNVCAGGPGRHRPGVLDPQRPRSYRDDLRLCRS
jgi:hypothetical protein